MKILKTHIRSLVTLSLIVLVFTPACIGFHPMPREQQLGSHLVSIKPFCESASSGSVTQAQKDGTSRIVSYEFICDDTKVEIRDNRLTVNGKSYGPLNEGDHIAVDFGKVRVNREVREEVR